jgi:hypothetical protein
MRLVCDKLVYASVIPKALKGITLTCKTNARCRSRKKHALDDQKRIYNVYRLESDILTMRYDALEEARAGFKALYEIELAKNSSRK